MMRRSSAELRVKQARALSRFIEEKVFDGNRSVISTNPMTGATDTVSARVARARGVFVDPSGKLRCSVDGALTNLDRANCDEGGEVGMKQGIPPSMFNFSAKFDQPGYRPTPSIRRESVFSPVAGADYGEALSGGADLGQVPDIYVWEAVQAATDRFDVVELGGGDGSSFVARVVDRSDDDKVYFVKNSRSFEAGGFAELDAGYNEIVANEVAAAMGLPVGTMRPATRSIDPEKLFTIQESVEAVGKSSMVQPVFTPDGKYDPVSTFGVDNLDKVPAHDVNNLASLLVFDWITANIERVGPNMFASEAADGKIHLLPVDNGSIMAHLPGKTDGFDDFLKWASGSDDDDARSGLMSVMGAQVSAGHATKVEVVDALESAVERSAAVDYDRIQGHLDDAFPAFVPNVSAVVGMSGGGALVSIEARADMLTSSDRVRTGVSEILEMLI